TACRELVFLAASEGSSGDPSLRTPERGELSGQRAAPAGAIGRYQLVRPIGEGAMGEVWAAQDSHLHRTVALKLLHIRGDEKGRERLLREARSLARLAHHNVVR